MSQLQKQLQGSAVQSMMFNMSEQAHNQFNNDQARKREQEDVATEKRKQQLNQIEGNLLALNLERDKYKSELSKLPENPKKGAQMRRREFLEKEI